MYVGYLASATVGASSPYIFTTKYSTNNNISYDTTTGMLTVKQGGWYKIAFSTSCASTGTVTPTLYKSGVASTYELASMTSSGATDFVNGSFTTIVYVAPTINNSYATLQMVNAGAAATSASAIITIDRIG